MASSKRPLFLYTIGCIAILTAPAGAATINYAKFYNGGTGYSGPFAGAGTVYDNTKALTTNCPSAGSCSSDYVASSISFVSGGISASASPTSVWDDLTPNFGGLGVGTGSPSDTDQIGGTDVLTINFLSNVKLTGIGTLFDTGHTPFGGGWPTPSSITGSLTFLLSTDGGAIWNTVSLSDANSMSLSFVGNQFEFKQNYNNAGAAIGPQFYVSALSYEFVRSRGSGVRAAAGYAYPWRSAALRHRPRCIGYAHLEEKEEGCSVVTLQSVCISQRLRRFS